MDVFFSCFPLGLRIGLTDHKSLSTLLGPSKVESSVLRAQDLGIEVVYKLGQNFVAYIGQCTSSKLTNFARNCEVGFDRAF